jgi:hypothetical protein
MVRYGLTKRRSPAKADKDLVPSSRVRNILSGQEEAERVVFDDPDPVEGFMIIPDLKWDMKTVSTLVSVPPEEGGTSV